MKKIFVCYRRNDSAGHTGRIVDSLRHRFGKRNVFMDVETVKAGTDFVDAIESALSTCHAVVVVMGRNWLDARDEKGQRRLDDPGDFIRHELAYALAREGVTVIPVLVSKALMPAAEDLPEELRELTRLQALSLSDERWDYDVERMLEALPNPSWTKRLVVAAAAVAVVLVVAGFVLRPALVAGGPKNEPVHSVPQLSEPGHYLRRASSKGWRITESSLESVDPSRSDLALEDLVGWCLRADLPAGYRLSSGEVDFCTSGYYARNQVPQGRALTEADLIPVQPGPENLALQDLVGWCPGREISVGQPLTTADITWCAEAY